MGTSKERVKIILRQNLRDGKRKRDRGRKRQRVSIKKTWKNKRKERGNTD